MLAKLRRDAREIFDHALSEMDAGAAVGRAVRRTGARLEIAGTEFDLEVEPLDIYAVAVGKAASASAFVLEEILGDSFKGGVLSTLAPAASLSERWRVYAGGHPLPNEASLAAARASFELLRRADHQRALVIFLISGGGSAMLEWPRDVGVTLADLLETNRALVSCGASIAEINAVRRALSAVKGGGLAACAPRAAQVTLIISDTNTGEEQNVASGPTLSPPADAPTATSIVNHYQLAPRLPASVMRALKQSEARKLNATPPAALRRHYVLLDNVSALERAAEAARVRGYVVEIARDLVEQPVEEGAASLVSRLFELQLSEASESRAVCLISGGEFACPVRGQGVGGRNVETALRCAIGMDALAGVEKTGMVALCAGTDGIDGNSPATGALADHTTLQRARALHLDARASLAASDAYTFFQTLGNAIHTGPTGTNVRDLRILIKG